MIRLCDRECDQLLLFHKFDGFVKACPLTCIMRPRNRYGAFAPITGQHLFFLYTIFVAIKMLHSRGLDDFVVSINKSARRGAMREALKYYK